MEHGERAGDGSDGGDPGAARGPRAAVVPMPVRGPGRAAALGPVAGSGAFTVDCADCTHRDTPVCDDCVVSFIVGREPDDTVVVDADEARAVRLLARAGLVPGVRHQVQASGL